MTHRCIIPATGYIDWQHRGKVKQPYYIHLKNQETFSFAGIWDDWKNPETGQTVSTYAIVTTDANPLLAEIHNRFDIIHLVLPVHPVNGDLIFSDVDRSQIPITSPVDDNGSMIFSPKEHLSSRLMK